MSDNRSPDVRRIDERRIEQLEGLLNKSLADKGELKAHLLETQNRGQRENRRWEALVVLHEMALDDACGYINSLVDPTPEYFLQEALKKLVENGRSKNE